MKLFYKSIRHLTPYHIHVTTLLIAMEDKGDYKKNSESTDLHPAAHFPTNCDLTGNPEHHQHLVMYINISDGNFSSFFAH